VSAAGFVHPNRTPDPDDFVLDAYIWVEDVDALYAEFRKKSLKIVRDICDQEYGCREFDIGDCNGYRLCFGQTIRR
jgi:predicted enzyme related to lactoylglutathione lyase